MQLHPRERKILEFLLSAHNYTSLDTLSSFLSVSNRTVYNDMSNLNLLFTNKGLPEIHQVRGQGYLLDKDQIRFVSSILDQKVSKKYYFETKDRLHFIFVLLLGGKAKVDIEFIQSLSDVSRNTVFSDLKSIRKKFDRYNLELDYHPKHGYIVMGDVIQRRSLFTYHMTPLVDGGYADDAFMDLFVSSLNCYERYLKSLHDIESKLNTEYIKSTLTNLAILLCVEKLEQFNVTEHIEVIDDVITSREYALVQSFFPDMDQNNLMYYSIHLLGSMVQISGYNPKVNKYTSLAVEMVQRFEFLSAIEFKYVSLLIKNLANHLAISQYRYRFGLHQSNPLTTQIKERYKDVFEITNQVCDVIRTQMKVPVSEGEVAYITLHFNSFIYDNKYDDNNPEIIVVCPQGVSTSTMLVREIQAIDASISVNKTMSLNQFYSASLSPKDLIISTVNLDTNLPYLRVNPLLDALDKENLRTKLLSFRPKNKNITTQKLMEILRPFVKEEDYHKVELAIDAHFHESSFNQIEHTSVDLESVLTHDLIQIMDQEYDWKTAIVKACEPLIKVGSISNDYPQAIIDATHKFGPYMILEHGFMLLHASYEDGVHDLGVSFSLLKHPIQIEDKIADKLFVLAPCDERSHLRMMSELLDIFTDPHLHIELAHAKGVDHVYKLLHQSA